MLSVGLTGGIGAGKSTVAQRLDQLGAVIVDADQIAREVVEPGTSGLEAVVEEFGPSVVAADGTLDRAALGRLVFVDVERRAALNAIVHPLVYERRTELVAQAPADAIVVEDVPLLVENRLAPGYPLVVVVHATEERRLGRLRARGMSADDARSRMDTQASDDDRRAAADVWLDNSGSVERLLSDVDELWRDRLVPFERNLRARRRAPRRREAVLVEHDPSWAAQGRRLAARLAAAAGERALRIDHVGSTSVPGLAAKDIIDLQVVVDDLDTAGWVTEDLVGVGFVPVPGHWYDVDREGRSYEKRVAVDADPARPVNVLVQPRRSPVWRNILLWRDWLRADSAAADEYAELKRNLAVETADVDVYSKRKIEWISSALERADTWAREAGWSVT